MTDDIVKVLKSHKAQQDEENISFAKDDEVLFVSQDLRDRHKLQPNNSLLKKRVTQRLQNPRNRASGSMPGRKD